MNLKDSYLHGSNTQGALLKNLGVDKDNITLTYATPDKDDNTKDATGTVKIPTWNLDTTGNAATATNATSANTAKSFPKALISKGTTVTTTAGETYGIAGSSTSGSRIFAKWFVNLDNGELTLRDGMIISFKIPVAGIGTSGDCISIDGTEAGMHPVVYNTNSLVTTHFPVNAIVTVLYDASQKASPQGVLLNTDGVTSYIKGNNKAVEITGSWRLLSLYLDGNSYDRTLHNGAVKAITAITAANLITGTSSGYQNLKSGNSFDISYPILYASAAINANATATNTYYSIPFTITTTQAATSWPGGKIEAYKSVFIQGKLDGNTFTPISTTPLTLVIPTAAEANGNDYYIYVGDTYSTTAAYLSYEHPIYWFKNGKFQLYNNAYVSSGKGYINGTEITTISGNAATATSVAWSGLTGDAPNISTFNNDAGYISSVSDLGLSNVLHFIGKATVDIEDGSNTDPIITGYIERKTGDVIIDKDNFYEYVWTIENKWEKLGSDGSYLLTSSVSGGGSDWGSSLTINGTTLTIPNKPTYSATDVGLDNVTNDAQVTDVSLYTGNSTDKDNTKSLSDGNVYIKLNKTISDSETEDSKILIKGGGTTSVTTDEDGNIIITGGSIPETNIIPATVTPNLILMSTTTSGTAKWGNISDMSLTILDALDKILKPEEWLEVADLSNKINYPIGTYAILILDNGTSDNYYSGVIMLGPATGRDAVDEVALHSAMSTASDSTAPTRIYLGVKQSKLYMASQDISSEGVNHNITIKINRLI